MAQKPTFWKGNTEVTSDFTANIIAHPETRIEHEDGSVTYESTEQEITVLVPYENLYIWDDAQLALHGIVKTMVNDVPRTISRRQFYQQLALTGTITTAEALAAMKTGDIPASIDQFLDQLTPEERFNAEMILTGANEFVRDHPLVAAIGDAEGLSDAQIDQFFMAAALL